MESKAQLRQSVLDEVKSLLIGPRNGDEEIVEGRLSLRYFAGVLYPQGEKRSDLANESGKGEASDSYSGDSDNPLSMANEELPSSLGISFVIKHNATFNILVKGAQYYDYQNDQNGLKNKKLHKRSAFNAETISSRDISSKGYKIFSGHAMVKVLLRKSTFANNCTVVTVTVINTNKCQNSQYGEKTVPLRIYQIELSCQIENGSFERYEKITTPSDNLEDAILQMQYNNCPTYAVGHGVSPDWKEGEESGVVTEIKTTYTPSQTVFRPTFNKVQVSDSDVFPDTSIFSIKELAFAKKENKSDICKRLKGFVDYYKKWIDTQVKMGPSGTSSAKDFLLTEMNGCVSRLVMGIKLLEDNDHCWDAFVQANLAMYFQIEQVDRIKIARFKRERDGEVWPIGWDESPDVINTDASKIRLDFDPQWRPFQIGFFLSSVFGLENLKSAEHDLVDLIWFSTGGGKTEAYLLLSSYELIRRRQRYPTKEDGYGCGVITRYTLKFLTADQFSRTASLACALEKVRSLNKSSLGEEPFSVGLYIGQTQSYKDYNDAGTALRALKLAPTSEHKFQITECPNCGTGLIPTEVKMNADGDELGFGINQGPGGKIVYSCTNRRCIFSKRLNIPISVIDEDIYKKPPSFILGTIDKFAMVPLRDISSRIFGKRDANKPVVPPSLIIQDELHLISGPLGTISAIYESAFDCLIKAYQVKAGLPPVGPKYVASSATVRDSDVQIRRLMGRKSAIFPPRGLNSSDSFFSRDERVDEYGRLYVGLMPQGIKSTVAAYWVNAALMQSVRFKSRTLGTKEELDFLWTLLCYCNSKRELGLISGAANQEIIERMKVYALMEREDTDVVEPLLKEEISSDAVKNISETRNKLLKSVSDSSESGVVEFVPCTNMVSVGIDIDRLGYMLVNGQPKTTAEYIQATSRVGRSPELKGPGLVFTLYSPAKPRDRSHYEHFKGFHQALYRLVEPTSVTPGSEQALRKACHAAIILLVRHAGLNMSGHKDAGNFDQDEPNIKDLLHGLKDRMQKAYMEKDKFERAKISKIFDEIVCKWHDWAHQRDPLVYESQERNAKKLMLNYTSSKKQGVGFKTMKSMRGVDSEVELIV